MMEKTKKFLAGLAVLIGSAIGAGVLGIPYVASKAGFLVGVGYILLIGSIIFVVNLYLGEIILRTKGKHQLGGYAAKYLGKKGRFFMNFAIAFLVYAAIVAYTFGIAESFSFLFFGDSSYSILIGVVFAMFMSTLLWRGLKALKRFEKWGVGIVLVLLGLIIILFAGKISFDNLVGFNSNYLFLPFGVVLFSLLSVTAIPEVNLVLKKDKKLMKKILILGSLIPIIFYILFAFVVVGFKGGSTPEIATLTLGPVFVVLGILAMFTSYLALGNALLDNFIYDYKYSKKKSWFLTAIIPIFLFLIIKMFSFFSFTKILSIGGVVSGGIIAVLVLLMIGKAKKKGDRKPEYKIPVNWFVIGLLSLIFLLGVVREVWVALR